MSPQNETIYRNAYGRMMQTGDALRKLVIEHKSAPLASLTIPAAVAEKLIEAQKALYEAQRLLEKEING